MRVHGMIGRKAWSGAGALFLAVALHGQASATESGASLYLLGNGGPGTAVMPPVEGIYLDKLIYVYDGDAKAEREFPLNGNIVAGLDTTPDSITRRRCCSARADSSSGVVAQNSLRYR